MGKKVTERIVALDIGIKFIGVAVTDPTWIFPVTLGSVKRKESIADDIERLIQMLENFDIKAFVIGWPLNSEGEEGKMTSVVKGFQRRLQELFPDTPFYREDESFSTDEATAILGAKNSTNKSKKKSGKIDSAAAAVILKRFMDSKEFCELKFPNQRNPQIP
jgi:putative holliday junction resolvase